MFFSGKRHPRVLELERTINNYNWDQKHLTSQLKEIYKLIKNGEDTLVWCGKLNENREERETKLLDYIRYKELLYTLWKQDNDIYWAFDVPKDGNMIIISGECEHIFRFSKKVKEDRKKQEGKINALENKIRKLCYKKGGSETYDIHQSKYEEGLKGMGIFLEKEIDLDINLINCLQSKIFDSLPREYDLSKVRFRHQGWKWPSHD